eukprot:816680-Rhodomonas_salina.2
MAKLILDSIMAKLTRVVCDRPARGERRSARCAASKSSTARSCSRTWSSARRIKPSSVSHELDACKAAFMGL